jgi:NhaP-type Na+/H+ or K+/H+ antiporter
VFVCLRQLPLWFSIHFLITFTHYSSIFFCFPVGVPGATLLALVMLYPRLILTSEPRRDIYRVILFV